MAKLTREEAAAEAQQLGERIKAAIKRTPLDEQRGLR